MKSTAGTIVPKQGLTRDSISLYVETIAWRDLISPILRAIFPTLRRGFLSGRGLRIVSGNLTDRP